MNMYGKFLARSKDTSLKLLLPLIKKSQRDIRSISIMASSSVPLPDRCKPVALPERALYMAMCSVLLRVHHNHAGSDPRCPHDAEKQQGE